MLSLNDYQDQANDTAIYPVEAMLVYPALGLTGEAGEVADKIKKIIRDNKALDQKERLEIAKEVGDVLWYIAALARDLGVDMETIARMNLEKLQSRKERGVLQGEGDNR
jgi:NTP pyrophosphatase (non-canonical NTP hydrolase)